MWEYSIIIILFLGALFYLTKHFWKTGKANSCGCGTKKSCKSS
ncbi:MAG: FeoB-associated Cys-rich membrane protein [Cytophagales bacterium]|nr:MAG: FeoB-associated Cys-rich membrane protein [Cytophagales bacterium]